ncbi:uncharacterized protein [Lolium perenne]|uniref:uncharacterized protein isoform X2 n=1 Tax=Lolium perenne TaxID=4522 RepID=UPI0021F5DFEB|nr:uncharacterized protein LOC127304345 isoform X3 [Lolium perenne]
MSSSLVRRLALLCRGRQMIRRHGGGDLRLATVLDSRRSFATSGRRRGANEDFVTRFRENRGSSSSSIISTGDAARPASLGRPQQGGDRAPLPFFTWARLAIGSVVAATAPFVHSKWASFLRIQSEVEMVKDMAETAAEVVEDVAAAAEKVSAEVSGQLPEDGRLRHAAVLVEHASHEVAEEARLAQDIIHKVDEIEEEVKAMIEPIADQAKHKRK